MQTFQENAKSHFKGLLGCLGCLGWSTRYCKSVGLIRKINKQIARPSSPGLFCVLSAGGAIVGAFKAPPLKGTTEARRRCRNIWGPCLLIKAIAVQATGISLCILSTEPLTALTQGDPTANFRRSRTQPFSVSPRIFLKEIWRSSQGNNQRALG